MRIALVSPYDWSVRGGVNSHVGQLAERFRDWGHDVTIVAPASNPQAAGGECVVMGKPRTVPVNGSLARISFSWKSREIAELLEQGSFDIVHCHEPLAPLLTYQVLRHSDAVNVGTFHAASEGRHRFYSYTRPFTRRWFRRLDGKIAVSPAAAQLASRYFPGYFNIIPNGIDYEHFAAEREPFSELADGRFNILFVGRPERRKGLAYLLRAFRRLHDQLPHTRLVVVGAGSFSRYEALMRPLGDAVVFRENVPYEELPRYHHSAHAFCSPATGRESQGIAVLEAMAAGLPVVASNIKGFAGIIRNEIDGLLVPPKDDAAIVHALRRLERDGGMRARLAGRGQERARGYGWDHVARRLLDYYERLLFEQGEVSAAQDGAGALVPAT